MYLKKVYVIVPINKIHSPNIKCVTICIFHHLYHKLPIRILSNYSIMIQILISYIPFLFIYLPATHIPPRHSEPSRRHRGDRDLLRHSAYATHSSHYVTPTPYSAPGVPTLASDAELQMVLDSLDKTSEVDYPLMRSSGASDHAYAFRYDGRL